MDINRDYKQISVRSFSGDRTDYNALKGKVVEKVGFTDRDSYDTQMLIITFTDKTFICVGVRYNLSDFHMNEPQLENYDVLPPQNVNNGDFNGHTYVDIDGNIRFETWIDILREVGIWQFTDEDALSIMKRQKKEEEEREYRNYLRLKKKFEKNGELCKGCY